MSQTYLHISQLIAVISVILSNELFLQRCNDIKHLLIYRGMRHGMRKLIVDSEVGSWEVRKLIIDSGSRKLRGISKKMQ